MRDYPDDWENPETGYQLNGIDVFLQSGSHIFVWIVSTNRILSSFFFLFCDIVGLGFFNSSAVYFFFKVTPPLIQAHWVMTNFFVFNAMAEEPCCHSRIIWISVYTLSDLGDLSNLIGSLSRTIQQYSPPSEWILCELGVFPIFLENDLLKVDKILGLTFFKARKDFEGFNTAFFNLL